MSSSISISRPSLYRHFLRTGVLIGLSGGLAEIAFVWIYSALTGGNAANVARQVAVAVGIANGSAATGIAVHLALAAMLGVGLNFILRSVLDQPVPAPKVFGLALLMLATIWGLNFFVVLPALAPAFVHLMPYSVTFFSKLMFGITAAATFCSMNRPMDVQEYNSPDAHS